MKKQSHLDPGWPEGKYNFSHIFIFRWTIPTIWEMLAWSTTYMHFKAIDTLQSAQSQLLDAICLIKPHLLKEDGTEWERFKTELFKLTQQSQSLENSANGSLLSSHNSQISPFKTCAHKSDRMGFREMLNCVILCEVLVELVCAKARSDH